MHNQSLYTHSTASKLVDIQNRGALINQDDPDEANSRWKNEPDTEIPNRKKKKRKEGKKKGNNDVKSTHAQKEMESYIEPTKLVRK